MKTTILIFFYIIFCVSFFFDIDINAQNSKVLSENEVLKNKNLIFGRWQELCFINLKNEVRENKIYLSNFNKNNFISKNDSGFKNIFIIDSNNRGYVEYNYYFGLDGDRKKIAPYFNSVFDWKLEERFDLPLLTCSNETFYYILNITPEYIIAVEYYTYLYVFIKDGVDVNNILEFKDDFFIAKYLDSFIKKTIRSYYIYDDVKN